MVVKERQNTSLTFTGIQYECMLVPVLVTAQNLADYVPIYLPHKPTLERSKILSIEAYHSKAEISLLNYSTDLAYPVIEADDMNKFGLTIQHLANNKLIDRMPLLTIEPNLRQGKKLAFELDDITTSKSYVEKVSPGALITSLPFYILLNFYYQDKGGRWRL